MCGGGASRGGLGALQRQGTLRVQVEASGTRKKTFRTFSFPFAPDILELLMAGRQPRRMNLIWFQRNPLPVDWEAQRQIVKRFEEDA